LKKHQPIQLICREGIEIKLGIYTAGGAEACTNKIWIFDYVQAQSSGHFKGIHKIPRLDARIEDRRSKVPGDNSLNLFICICSNHQAAIIFILNKISLVFFSMS